MPDATEPSLVERLRGQLAMLLEDAPAGLQRLTGGRPTVVDGQTLDPTLQAVLALRPRVNRAEITREEPISSRARLRREILAVRPTPTPVAGVRDLTVDGAESPLDARLYTPKDGGRPPLLVYFHGGGFTQGDLDTHDEPCRILCREAGQAVLSVAYRLAPEHPFPAAPDDALAAFRWAQQHAADLGTDPGCVLIGGDSAGGNLAAVTAQAARDDHPPSAQFLIYPPTDTPTGRPSRHLFDDFFLSDAERDAYHQVYTHGTGAPPDDPRISPLYGTLAGLAPAFVVTAGFDVLRDEGEAYAEALREAGTPVEWGREDALVHGFVNMTGISRAARRAMRDLAHRWRRFVAHHTA